MLVPDVSSLIIYHGKLKGYPLQFVIPVAAKLNEEMKSDFNHELTICIDRGGTFTDCIGFGKKQTYVVKLLSEDPTNYPDAPREAIRRILELATGKPLLRSEIVPTEHIRTIRMGTTVVMANDANGRLLMHYWNERDPKQYC
jgi:hypothetical protein